MNTPRGRSLLWKLLAINLVVVGIAMAVASITIEQRTAGIFMSLMKQFKIEVDPIHGQFMAALTRSLVLASLIAGGIGLLLSLVLFREVVRPLRSMMAMAGRIAAGDYRARGRVTSRDEIGSLAESLNRMAEALQTLERLRKDLVANVAHELRTPLSNLRGYLEAMRDGVAPPSPAALASLHEEVMRLVRLTDALHKLSLFDAHLPRMRPEATDLGALVRRLLDLHRVDFQRKGIALHTDGMPNGRLQVDPDLLAQALTNLIDNALKYTAPGGSVTVRAAADGPAMRIAVTNTGEPIASEDLPFIFERFYRAEKSRSRASGGAGIGLSIVKEVARVHGGDVGAESRGGETTVWLTLPLSATGTD